MKVKSSAPAADCNSECFSNLSHMTIFNIVLLIVILRAFNEELQINSSFFIFKINIMYPPVKLYPLFLWY